MTPHPNPDLALADTLLRLSVEIRHVAGTGDARAGEVLLVIADQADAAATQIETLPPRRMACGHTSAALLRLMAGRIRALSRIFMPPSPADAAWDLRRPGAQP